MKGSTVTMGIRKVSVQNSADWQGEEASQYALSADPDVEEALSYCNSSNKPQTGG